MNFQNQVVYQIYPRSFKDTNHDGFGDIKGITEKLDYLKDLGVDYIWSTPFFVSPQNDNGYDVQDYYNIEPAFGTMADAEELIREADARGIGIMFDMVFNHTSTKHEWFQKALTGDPEYMDYYIFRDGSPDEPPTNWVSKFGGNAWEYVPSLKKWYLHLFDVTQADLNWDNPKVRDELKKVIRFWQNKGVKGFRFDVVNLISKPEVLENDYEGDGRRFYTDGPHIHEYLNELVHDTGLKDMITVGEMSSTSLADCVKYAGRDKEELSMVFSFHHLKVDYANGNKWVLKKADLHELNTLFETWQTEMQKNNAWNALFLNNHDQPRANSRFGDVDHYWKESSKMLAMLIHMMRGTPYIYQGEELGMTNAYFTDIREYRDVESINYYRILMEEGRSKEEALELLRERSRDNSRTPMQWNRDRYAGFSDTEPWITMPTRKPEANAADEIHDPDSIYSWYKALIRFRKEHSAISDGSIRFILHEQDEVIGYVREDEKEALLVLNNMTGSAVPVKTAELNNAGPALMHNYPDVPVPEEGSLVLRPYECLVISLLQ